MVQLDHEEATAAVDRSTHPRHSAAGTRAGAVAAMVANGVLLYVAENILAWDLLSFLTDDYNRVLPAIRLTLLVTIGLSLMQFIYPARWFTTVTDAVSTGFGLYAAVRLFQIFPFEFDDAGPRWDLVMRAVLIIAIAGSLITLIVAPLKLISSAAGDQSSR